MKKNTDGALLEQLLGKSDSVDVQKLLKVFASRWWWIAIALAVAGSLCFLYLKLVTPQYIGTVTLKYLAKQSELDELGGRQPTFVFSTSSSEYLTEKYTVRSPEVVQNTLVKMGNPFSFYRIKDLRRVDVYPFRTLDLEILSYDAAQYQFGTFVLNEELGLSYRTEASETTPVRLNRAKVIQIPGLQFRVKRINTAPGYQYEFELNDPIMLVNSYVGRIDMEETEDEMPVMNLTFTHHNYDYTKDFLRNLIEAYREYDLSQKQQSSDLTIHFIEDQVEIYSASLKEAARELEQFKQKNQLLDISSSAIEITTKVRELEQRKNELEIQKAYISMLENNMGKTFETVDYLSIGLDGTTDAVLLGLLERFNTLITQRKGLLLKYSPNSATVRNLDEELSKFRSQILDNIELQNQKNTRTLRILNDNIATLKGRFSQIPALEKNYIYLQSNFEVNQNIYSLLMNKEIESSIVRAGMLPSFRVITQLYTDKISPNPPRVVLLFLLGGLAIGLGLVMLARNFNNTFSDISKVDQHENVGLLGIVHHFSEKVTASSQDLSLFLNDRTVFTESMSALRTRLSFAKSLVENSPAKQGKLVLITSERAGEGKSFVTVNLALSLTKIGKKVVIIGADLRKSRVHLYFESGRNSKGLSTYLQADDADIAQVVNQSAVKNLDYIPAGPPPFNPGELLQKPLMDELLDYCKNTYDYVLLDTAPVGLVADNIPLLNKSDHVLFIIRWLFSNTDSYRLAGQLAEEYNLKEVKVIVNDFYPDNLHSSLNSGSYYGSGYSHYQYGYAYQDSGYLSKPIPRWKKRLAKLFSFKKS